jgi:tetratricopeptide (TPR) repeat protein
MHAAAFVNRVEELKVLRGKLAPRSGENTIILIHGNTGVGKSALTGKLIAEHPALPGVKVRTLAGEQKDGHYIHELAKALDEASERLYIPSLQRFLRHVPSVEMRKHYARSLATSLGEIDPTRLAKAGDLVWQWIAGTGQFSAERLFRSTQSEVTLTFFEYIKHVWQNHRFILNFENVQSMDRPSLELMLNLFAIPRDQRVLLELTLDKPGVWTSAELRESIRARGCRVETFHLEMLPFKDVARLMPPQQAAAILEHAYYEANGNLKDFGDLQVVFFRDPTQGDVPAVAALSGTSLRISLLHKSAIFTLCCIAVHEREVNLDLLHALVRSHPYFASAFIDTAGALQDLESETLVQTEQGRVRVTHDWVADVVLSGPEFMKYRDIARQAWANLYGELFRSADYSVASKSEVLYHLFAFLLETSVDRLYDVVEEIKRFALSSLYPRSTLVLLEKLRTRLTAKQDARGLAHTRVSVAILDIFYQLGLFEEACAALDAMTGDMPLLDVYWAAVLDRLDRHDEAIQLIRHCLSQPRSPLPEYTFYLKLILMVSYRSRNQYTECEDVFNELIRNPEYRALPAYPYLLRNAEIVLPEDQAVASVEESIRQFVLRENPTGEAHSRITLAMYLAIAGKIEAAEQDLDRAERLLQSRSMERHVVLNDRAVLRLLRQPEDCAGAIALLNSAISTVTTSFDYAAVYNNLLIAYTRQHNHGAAEELERRILALLPQQPDQVLHRSLYYNLAYAAGERHDTFSAERFRARAEEIGSMGDPYWELRLSSPGGTVSECDDFMLAFPFHPVFITNWHLEIVDFTDETGTP